MAEVFISYARTDQGFARDLSDALRKLKRDTWIDWRSIPDSAKWRAEIFAAIEAADNFLFVISPDSLRPDSFCGPELAHAFVNNKRVITILYHQVDMIELLPELGEIQLIKYPELGFEETFRRLIAVLDTDLEWVHQHTRLAEKARDWENNKRNESFLLRGMALQDAVNWLVQSTVVNERKPLPLQEEYIRASQEWEAGEIERLKELTEHETRQKKRFRRFSLVLGVALLLALLAVGFALWQRSVARAREMVSASILSQDADPEISVLIAAQGVAATWPWVHAVLPEAQHRLHDAILASHVRLTLSGHSDSVSSVAWSPDGMRLATASDDGTAKVWDAATGKKVLTLSGHSDSVSSVAWSPDGRQLATASKDQTAKVWDAATGKKVLTLSGHSDSVSSVAWSPDGKRLATASADQTAKVWDAATGKEVLTLSGHSDSVSSVAWSPDGKRLATASDDGTVKVWDAARGKVVLVLRGYILAVSVAWSPDGKRLATASKYQTADVWDAATGKQVLILGSYSRDQWVLNTPLGFFSVSSVAWSPDGKQLATSSGDHTAKVWDAATGEQVLALSGHSGFVNSVAWSPNGKQLATASADQTAKVWDAATGEQVLLALSGHSGFVNSVAWSPNGKQLATASADQTAKVWDAATGEQVLTLSGHNGFVNSVAWSPDGKQLATASADQTAKVWDATKGNQVLTLGSHSGDAGALGSLHGAINEVAWSPDGRQLATASDDGTAKVWDAATGKQVLTLSGHRLAISVAWSPDGRRLATASGAETAKVWDAATGKQVLTLGSHSGDLWVLSTHFGDVSRVAWSADSRQLVTASDDGTAKVWDAVTGKEVLTLSGHGDSVSKVAWSPDGKRLATASRDGTVQVYEVDIRNLMNLARQRVTASPSSDSCKKYLHVDKCPPFPTLAWW